MIRFLLCFLAILFAAGSVSATETAKTEQAEVTLLAAQHSLDLGQDQVLMGLEFRLQPGWKIYWRAPGAGGRPPVLNWREGSRNIAALEVQWPFPSRFLTYGLISNGYENQVILPLIVTRNQTDRGLELDMRVDFFICNSICIPDQVLLRRKLVNGEGSSSLDAARILAAQSRVSKTGTSALKIAESGAIQGHDGQRRMDWIIDSPVALAEIDAFFDAEAEFSYPVFDFTPDRRQVRLSVQAERLDPDESIALVLKTKTDAATVFSRHEQAGTHGSGIAWGWVLLLAFAGGVFINVMPCVLPILCIKIFAAMNRPPERRRFLVMSLGIISTFGVLGGVFALLRATGTALHWGMQFQQPVFLSAMVFVLAAFGTQLLGWWQIRLPGLAQFSATPTGILGDFMIGVITAILATPCSAPLVGSSIALALFLQPLQMILILLVMGAGMAMPYLLLALYPPILGFLPRPGRWMEYLKILLACSVFGTAFWMVWLLLAQIGLDGAMTIFVIAALMVFALGMVKFPETKIAPHRFKLAILLLVLGLVVPTRFQAPDSVQNLSEGWQGFAPETIARHVADGKTVLVDISADWCLTCQVNDRLVFDRPEMVAWRGQDNVVPMRGDWSKPDAEIKSFLARYQKQALPFAILFTPRAPEGILLPELVTMSAFRQIHAEAQAQEF